MRNIKELSLQDLGLVLKEWGAPAYQAQEIFSWIYQKGARDFSVMSNIPLKLRKKLEEGFFLNSLRIIEKAVSVDKTEKFLFQAEDGNFIEGVIIPARGRVTACISTQAGCKFSCRFCASGMLGFKRDLTTAEMLDELVYLKNNSPDKKLTHIVFMGTGEPLDNYDAVMGTIKVINSPHAFVIGARKITISTCGIAPGIARLSREGLQIELSVSLHAADDRTRSVLMPVNKKYPLAQLLNACREYIAKTNRQITFEYVLIKGVNSDLQSARKLSTILKGLRLAKVNLIPSNPVKELGIIPPAKAEVISFRDFLLKQGIIVTLRAPRGQDIEAACGQLRLRHGTRPRSGLGRCSSTMKNKLFFLAVLLALLFTGCAKREVVNIDSKGKNIICFGDSLTFGYGVNPGEDYPAGLYRRIGAFKE
ncbi:MAG: 23S rRNA (adenine(2503)-C(2))-methyltransferase RlmN [Candidatus Omnitrophica bacterium]|nr:23S rRNA (adenine(2503)-C(2))-methyltransferase RlmN [Candidatus Omnitrophota bacterium]